MFNSSFKVKKWGKFDFAGFAAGAKIDLITGSGIFSAVGDVDFVIATVVVVDVGVVVLVLVGVVVIVVVIVDLDEVDNVYPKGFKALGVP